MNSLYILKTMLRSPAKTLVTFVLLVATSFAFVSRGVEYTATVRQINTAEASYSAVGTVQKTLQGYYDYMVDRVGEEVYELEDGVYLDRTDRAIVPLDDTVLDILATSDYIDAMEVRLVSGGTHEECESAVEQPLTDIIGYDSWQDSFEEFGTFCMTSYLILAENYGHGMMLPSDPLRNIRVESVLVGHTSLWRDGQRFALTTGNRLGYDKSELSDYKANGAFFAQSGEVGSTIIIAGDEHLSGSISPYSSYNTTVDYPLLDYTRMQTLYGVTDVYDALSRAAECGNTPFVRADGRPVVPVGDFYATVERNLHTSEVVYTSDMSLIPKVHGGALFASSGRLLPSGDHNDVCVIGANFAEHNDLQVGDHITLDLCADTLVHSGKVFARETPYPTDRDVIGENQLTRRGLPNVTKTFEIVGIWSDVNFDVEDPFTYSLNTIFVPADCYPWQGEVEASALPSTLSFRLKHPGDVAAIEAELGDQLAALGYELRIDDGGYATAKPNLEFMKLSALIGFVGMSLALLLALVLITYLFIIRKKKDYAIMRALGTPRGKSNRSLLFGLLTLATVAIIIGAVAAGIVEQSSTAKMAADVAEITGDASKNGGAWGLTALFGVGTLALVWLFARVGLAKISRTPPLELLQGSGR